MLWSVVQDIFHIPIPNKAVTYIQQVPGVRNQKGRPNSCIHEDR